MRILATVAAGTLLFAVAACGTDEEAERERAEAEKQVAELTEELEDLRQRLDEGKTCEKQLSGFNRALGDLDAELNVGLNFHDYSESVRDAAVAYERIDVDDLADDCALEVGLPLEKALRKYVDAEEVWEECFERLSCDLDSIDPKLQRLWAAAGDLIDQADDGISQLVSDIEDQITESEQELEQAESTLAKYEE